VKAKQDQVRGIIERTRGDVALAATAHRTALRFESARDEEAQGGGRGDPATGPDSDGGGATDRDDG
jgi:hypothetical protein